MGANAVVIEDLIKRLAAIGLNPEGHVDPSLETSYEKEVVEGFAKKIQNAYPSLGPALYYESDCDKKVFLEIKRFIMDMVKEYKDDKKLKAAKGKSFRTLLTKLNKIIREDMVIYNGIFVLPGENSERESVVKGKLILKLKEEYQQLMSEIIPTDDENGILLIPNIDALKKLIDDYEFDWNGFLAKAKETKLMLYVPMSHASMKAKNLINGMFVELDTIREKMDQFIPVPIDLENHPEYITLKEKFTIQYDFNFPKIEVNLQVFPFVSDKEAPEITYVSYPSPYMSDVYIAMFHIDYSIFDIYLRVMYF